MEYKCSLCEKKIEDDLTVYIDHTEKHIVEEIQSDHPEWVNEDGICPKCVDYYRKQMKGDPPAGS